MVTTWGRKTDDKYIKKNSGTFHEKNHETKMQMQCVELSQGFDLYEA